MNRKYVPLILMLAAGAITCVVTFIRDFSILGKLGSLLFVLVVFYFLGSVLKWTLDYFDRQNEAAAEEEEKEEEEEESGGEELKAQSQEGEQ